MYKRQVSIRIKRILLQRSLISISFRVLFLPNGRYWIAVEANPKGNLVEHDSTNNVSYRKIRLGGTAENRWVRVPQVGIIDESQRGGYWY